MSVLRDKSQSLMAMLEAFVYDPLISWRLLATNKDQVLGGVTVTADDTEEVTLGEFLVLVRHLISIWSNVIYICVIIIFMIGF